MARPTANETEDIFTKLRGIVGNPHRDLQMVIGEIREVIDSIDFGNTERPKRIRKTGTRDRQHTTGRDRAR